MVRIITFILLALTTAVTMARAQPGSRSGAGAGAQHAFERIEKSLREFEALAQAQEPRIRALIDELRQSAENLRQALTGEEQKRQIQYRIRLVDLSAKGAEEAWRARFGAIPTEACPLRDSGDHDLKDFPGLIAAPQILTEDGQQAQLSIGEDHECAYLERVESGAYLPRTTTVSDGLRLMLEGSVLEDGSTVTELEIDLTRIAGKTEYVPEAPTVGMPLLSRKAGKMTVVLGGDRTYALMPLAEGKDGVIMLIRATVIVPGAATPAKDR
ncbi:MAG: hypothetical protein H6807_10865 [Planctomycetes bacterium]|nr:hypothetical protein [Planctomycetota bacterium]